MPFVCMFQYKHHAGNKRNTYYSCCNAECCLTFHYQVSKFREILKLKAETKIKDRLTASRSFASTLTAMIVIAFPIVPNKQTNSKNRK